MATNDAAVVEDRAGITFGVELYVPWDAPEAVMDISSAGVIPLRHISGCYWTCWSSRGRSGKSCAVGQRHP